MCSRVPSVPTLFSGNGGCLTFAGPGFLLKTTGSPPHMSAGIRAISLRAFYEKVKEGKLSANAAAIEAKKRAERERSSKTDNITLKAGPSSRGALHLKPSQGPRAFQFWPAANQ